MSKIPVREALVQLRSEGLVDIFAHRGFQVRGISVSEFEEVFGLRIQIEPAAANAQALTEAIEEAGYTPVPVQAGAAGSTLPRQGGCCCS